MDINRHNIIRKLRNIDTDTDTKLSEAILQAIEDVKKQISINPIDIRHIEFNGSMISQFKAGRCPCCHEYVDSDDDRKFCSKCGQKLDWSDPSTVVLDSLPILGDEM